MTEGGNVTDYDISPSVSLFLDYNEQNLQKSTAGRIYTETQAFSLKIYIHIVTIL